MPPPITSGAALPAFRSYSQVIRRSENFLIRPTRRIFSGWLSATIEYSNGASTLNAADRPAHCQFFPQKTKLPSIATAPPRERIGRPLCSSTLSVHEAASEVLQTKHASSKRDGRGRVPFTEHISYLRSCFKAIAFVQDDSGDG